MAQDKDIWKTIFVHENNQEISFKENGKLDSKYLIAVVNIEYTNRQRHFKRLYIQNNHIESIEENDFDGIRFDEISIKFCPKLKQIHWNAFGQQSKLIKKFNSFYYLPDLTSKPNTDYDLFKLINSLICCEEIEMFSFYNELQLIKLNNLKTFIFCGYSSIKIESICDFAFYECDQIQLINFHQNHISFISENAFYFRSSNHRILQVNLCDNKMNQSSFASNCFSHFKRPTKLHLYHNKIRYLDVQMFKSLLNVSQQNQVGITKVNFNEKHFQNRWIQKLYKKRIILI